LLKEATAVVEMEYLLFNQIADEMAGLNIAGDGLELLRSEIRVRPIGESPDEFTVGLGGIASEAGCHLSPELEKVARHVLKLVAQRMIRWLRPSATG
jgi:hypothetical protein